MLAGEGGQELSAAAGKGKGQHPDRSADGCEGDPFASLLGCNLASNLVLLVRGEVHMLQATRSCFN